MQLLICVLHRCCDIMTLLCQFGNKMKVGAVEFLLKFNVFNRHEICLYSSSAFTHIKGMNCHYKSGVTVRSRMYTIVRIRYQRRGEISDAETSRDA